MNNEYKANSLSDSIMWQVYVPLENATLIS